MVGDHDLDHDRFEIPLKTHSEERPRGAYLCVSEAPPSLRGCVRRERLAWRHRPSEGRLRHPLSRSWMASLGTEGTL